MPGWLKGCAIGCGVMVLLTVVSFIGCGVTVLKPFKDAVKAREELETAFGEVGDYVPPADGRAALDRMEAFLAVRQDLQDMCGDFEATFSHFEKMDRMDDDSTSGGEKVGLVLGTMSRAIGLPRLLGRYHVARNTALLEHGIGLGEYTYLYAVGYYAVLGRSEATVTKTDVSVTVEDHRNTSRRLRRDLRGMLHAQLAALEDAGSDPELLPLLRDEVAALDDDASRLPWQDGAPPAIAASFAPYRERMDALWCEYANEFALSVARQGNNGFSITSD